jgi:hypothetical protein
VGGPELAGAARSAARLGGSREKVADGIEVAAGTDRVAAASEIDGGAVEDIEAEAAEVVITRSVLGVIPCKT